MTPSIRTFLLINLLIMVTLITSLAIVGNLFLAHKDIQTNLDTQLIMNSLRIQAFFDGEPSAKQRQSIQKKLSNININHIDKNHQNHQTANDITVEFQIWNHQGHLILHSKNAPLSPLSNNKNGFSNKIIEDLSWRVYTLTDTDSHLTFMLAEHTHYRKKLENQLTQDSLFIMLITYPFLGLLIWVIVGRGLASLKAIANEVKHRDPRYLDPFDLKSIPSEVTPLINELNNLFQRLKEAFHRHERFTADAAHELKTPLAALSTQTQVALRAETQKDRNQALLKVIGGVNRCTHLIQQLLTLSRMAPEAGIQNPTPVTLSRVASEVAAMLAPDAIAKNIDLELLAPNSTSTVIGNPTAINILIRNLVDNAIRYTQKDSFVKINIEETDNNVILSVTDNGPGIPKELRERVFERFFRMVGTKAAGSGLGLGIVLQIAKLHKAEINLLTPTSGEGLQVEIRFPKSPSA